MRRKIRLKKRKIHILPMNQIPSSTNYGFCATYSVSRNTTAMGLGLSINISLGIESTEVNDECKACTFPGPKAIFIFSSSQLSRANQRNLISVTISDFPDLIYDFRRFPDL